MADPIPAGLIRNWFYNTHLQTLETRDHILSRDNFTETTREIVAFALVSVINSCQPDLANRVLEKLFQIPDVAIKADDQSTLELMWHSFPGRPSNTPWTLWDDEKLSQFKNTSNPESMDFYGEWTQIQWIVQGVEILVNDDDDTHKWKSTQDPWIHANCARFLCRPNDGNPPSRENVEEAFEAVDKLFTQLPLRGPDQPHGHIFPSHIYFVLANYLGHAEKALTILKMASQEAGNNFDLHSFVDIGTMWDMLATSKDNPLIKILDRDRLESITDVICTALDTRLERGCREPFHGVSMAELLSRFTIAAFFVHRDEYIKNEINSPEEILYPPLTPERIAEIETELGPLPEDVKEMALIGDGFCGGWHFAGGGWPGIGHMTRTSARDYELYLGYEPQPEKEIRTKHLLDGTTQEFVVNVIRHGDVDDYNRRGWGDVLVGTPQLECDNYEHVLCPPEVWRRYQEYKGVEVTDGEYAYLHFADWTDGGEIHRSVREWIAGLTMCLEQQVAIGEREECPE